MKPIWIFPCLLSFANITTAENFAPFPHDTASASVHQYNNSEYHRESIDEVISTGTDDEQVKISGEIIKKLKRSTYLFRDETGEIPVHIEDQAIPEKGLLFGSPTTIKGEVVKEPGKPVSIDADKIRYMF